MNKRERLEAAIEGRPVDRLPVALWRHWPGDDQDADALTASHLAWQQAYDWDFVKASPSSSYCLDDWGAETRWEGHMEGTRTYLRPVINEPDDWLKLKPLDPGKGMLATQLAVLRQLNEQLDAGVPTIATIFSPLSQAKNLVGPEMMLSHMRSHPVEFRAGLDTIRESTLRFVEAAKRTGISGIYYAIQHTQYQLMSRAEYERFGLGDDIEILEMAGDLWLNIVHIHGDSAYFDLASAYPTPVINWHDRECGTDLAGGLRRFEGAASGGVSRWSMMQDAPDAALAEAADAVAQTNGRRLILGTGCVIMVTTPLRNIRALRAFAESAGNV